MNYLQTLLWAYKTKRKWANSGLHLTNGYIPSETYVKYPPNSTFEGRKVLNVGCGRNVYKHGDVINTDLVKAEGVDMALDLTNPLPFADNTFDFIIANHVLEHVPGWWNCFKELARVVKVGGKIEVWVPPVSSDSSFTYRDHINSIGMESFAGCRTMRRAGTNLFAAEEFKEAGHVQNLEMSPPRVRPILKWWCWYAPNWLLSFITTHLRNTVSEIGFFFTKVAP
jgi:predicted SAM-dependent methyltransferase